MNSSLPCVGEHASESLLRSYQTIPGTYDEMMDPALELRAHWQRFISGVGGMSEEDLTDETSRIQN